MMEGIIFRNGENDFELWLPDIPKEALDEIETILMRYNDTGYSVRGTREDIAEEIKSL